MPTSAPYAIPVIVHAVRQLEPRSILDVGIGFGKYGVLFREYLDIWNAGDVTGIRRDAWGTRLDGIEIFAPYLTPLHDYIYDHVHVGDALDLVDGLDSYDVIFMGDVLEHFDKPEGKRLIGQFYQRANKCVLLTYPANAAQRGPLLGNPAEAHRSVWRREDFDEYEQVAYTCLENRADVCAIAKPPHTPPFLVGCFAARRRTGWQGRIATALVRTLGPGAASSLTTRFLRRPITLRSE